MAIMHILMAIIDHDKYSGCCLCETPITIFGEKHKAE